MTISTYGSFTFYVADGATTTFVAPRVSDSDDTLVVRVDGVLKVRGTDYILNRDTNIPTVKFGTAPTNAAIVTCRRVSPRAPQVKALWLGNDQDPLDILQELLDNGLETRIGFSIPTADIAANTSKQLVSSANGRLVGLETIVQATVTTGGTIVPAVGTTPVVGWGTHSHAAKLAVGNQVSSVIADETVATAFATKGQRLQLTLASFATAGALEGHLIIRPWG